MLPSYGKMDTLYTGNAGRHSSVDLELRKSTVSVLDTIFFKKKFIGVYSKTEEH